MFNTKPKISKIQDLDNRSTAAISIFKNTLDSLNDIEIETNVEVNAKQTQIDAINDDIAILKSRKNSNRKFINKLNEFFE